MNISEEELALISNGLEIARCYVDVYFQTEKREEFKQQASFDLKAIDQAYDKIEEVFRRAISSVG